MCVAQLVRCHLFFSVDFSVKVQIWSSIIIYELEVTQKPLILCVCERESLCVCACVGLCVCVYVHCKLTSSDQVV